MKTLLQHALTLAKEGYYVFRLYEGERIPLKGIPWREASTIDKITIKEWWSDPVTREPANYNIGIDAGKSGILVVDVDIKDGKQGAKSYGMLDMTYGFPATRTITTTSGGKHHYYQATGYGNPTNFPGKHLDIRNEGGFVVAPGSVINGNEYTVDTDTPALPVVMPEWLGTMLSKHKSRTKDEKDHMVTDDSDAQLEKAKRWLLDTAEPALQGDGGDHITFATAAKLREFGLSEAAALDAMLEHWNDRCSPPWGPEELQRKIENAYIYAKEPQGSASPQAEFDAIPVEVDQQYFTPTEPSEGLFIPARPWVFGHIALAKQVTLLVAPPGVGKSTLAMLFCLSKASGKNIAGMSTYEKAPVAFYNNEDDMEELNRRKSAFMQHFDIKDSDLTYVDKESGTVKPTLFLNSGEQHRLKIAMRAGDNGTIKPAEADKIVEALKHHGIKILVVDPFSETHPANENDNNEILEVAAIYRSVAQKANCAIILVHHDRKPEKSDSTGHIGNMYSARGASSLTGVARVICTYHTMPKSDAKAYNVQEEDRTRYVRLDIAKANMSATTTKPFWFERVTEKLRCDPDDFDMTESVGVLRPVGLTKPDRKISDESAMLAEDMESLFYEEEPNTRITLTDLADRLINGGFAYEVKDQSALQRRIRSLFKDGAFEVTNGIFKIIKAERRGARLAIAWYPAK